LLSVIVSLPQVFLFYKCLLHYDLNWVLSFYCREYSLVRNKILTVIDVNVLICTYLFGVHYRAERGCVCCCLCVSIGLCDCATLLLYQSINTHTDPHILLVHSKQTGHNIWGKYK